VTSDPDTMIREGDEVDDAMVVIFVGKMSDEF
jgi:hypothetical protein